MTSRAMQTAIGLLLIWSLSPIPPALSKTSPPPAMQVSEVRGSGQPLARRWVDLDGDGKLDLLVVSGTASTAPPGEEARIETLIAYLNVTPFFLDKRQVLLYRQTKEGFEPWGEPLPLTGDTAAVDVADLDGDGRPEIIYAAGYRLFAFTRKEAEAAYSTTPRILGDAGMLLGYARAFVPGARLVAELVKGAPPALLLSTSAGLEIRRAAPEGTLARAPDLVLRSGFRTIEKTGNLLRLQEPRPSAVDADADGTLDLVYRGIDDLLLYRGEGEGRFAREPLRAPLFAHGPRPGGRQKISVKTTVTDVDGDGRLDLVRIIRTTQAEEDDEQDERGEKKQEHEEKKKEKKGPVAKVEILRGRPGFTFPDDPDVAFDVPRTEKHEGAEVSPEKIDADGRADLVVTRFAVSMWQIARFLMTKKISVQVSFETMLQRTDGTFAPPKGKPFETKLTIDLKRGFGSIPTRPQGDFNGDGITDLPEFTDAPELRVHATTSDGVFPAEPAFTVRLPRAPEDRSLVDILDLDGDGRADVAYFNLEGAGFVATVARSGR